MSRLTKAAEFGRSVAAWSESFEPISLRQAEIWLKDVRAALAKLPYLQSIHGDRTDELECMLRLRGVIGLPRGAWDGVYKDLEDVWSSDLAGGLRAFHSLLRDEHGFEFRFAARNEHDQYVTGRLRVDAKA